MMVVCVLSRGRLFLRVAGSGAYAWTSSATDLLPLAIAKRIAHTCLMALRGAERREGCRVYWPLGLGRFRTNIGGARLGQSSFNFEHTPPFPLPPPPHP